MTGSEADSTHSSPRQASAGHAVAGRSAEDIDRLVKRRRDLEARLRARGMNVAALDDIEAGVAPPLTERAMSRLCAFSESQVESVRSKVGAVEWASWPEVEGCLGVLFTSRAGSSYLARELAGRFDIGRMEESLNPHLVEGIAAATIVKSFTGRWFSFKLGVPGIISAELTGVLDRYIDDTRFIFLLRRDVVAQAVSLVKANQTGKWHSISVAKGGEPFYDGPRIAQAIRVIANAVASLGAYLERAERPWRRLFYEDFAQGDFSSAAALCEGFGVPAIAPGAGPKFAPLERTADAVNDLWIERFRDEIDPRTQDTIDTYRAYL